MSCIARACPENNICPFIIQKNSLVGEVRDSWNTGTEETFKLLPSWWPYSLGMWLWILYLWTTVLSVNRKNMCRSEKNSGTFFFFEALKQNILQSFSDIFVYHNFNVESSKRFPG